jgi:metallophosphoesterase superfamily enzyme
LENDKLFNIHGHVHPGIIIKGKAKQSLKFPCFYFTKNYVILPAFSSFSGLKIMENRKAEAIFIIANNKIIKSK